MCRLFAILATAAAVFVGLTVGRGPLQDSAATNATVAWVYRNLARELGLERAPDPGPVRMHAEYDTFRQAGGSPGILAFYDAGSGTIHALSGAPNVQRFLVHAAVLQFLDRAFGRGRVPVWLAEGLAEYVSAGEVDPARNLFRVHTTRTLFGNSNLLAIQRLIAERRAGQRRIPLTDLWALSREEFDKRSGTNGASAWAVVYWLMNAPDWEGGEGEHRAAVRALLDAAAEELPGNAAWARAMPGIAPDRADREIERYFRQHPGAIPDSHAGGFLVRETEHYTVMVDASARTDRETAEQILDRFARGMELIFTQYALAFQFDGRLTQKGVARLYPDRESYHSRGGGPPGSAAYYNPATKELVGYETVTNGASTFNIFCHEGCHQFFDLAFPGFYTSQSVPMWFSEGLADCFGASYIQSTGGRPTIYIFSPRQGVANWRLPVVRQMVAQGNAVPLRDLVRMERQEFYGARAGEYYAQAWSFCHFLWCYPNYDRQGDQYDEILKRLIDGFKRGLPRDEVYQYAFRIRDRPFTEADWQRIQAQWEAYIRNWPNR